MPALKMLWANPAKQQFEKLHQRAADSGHLAEFAAVHNEIVAILRDLDQALERSDPLYNTRKPGGVVRHLLHGFISVTFCLYPADQVGWVTKYLPVSANWPEQGPSNS